MILFVNACVRKDSRTEYLAKKLLAGLNGPIEEVSLKDIRFPATDEAFLEKRERLFYEGRFDDPVFDLARQFADADEIVIAAPYWDLSFPASLKQYIEQINSVGITFRYSPEGMPEGLCKAKRLTYITTAGGDFVPKEYGFGYIETLARTFYGIEDVRLIKAEGLDIVGADTEEIMRNAEKEIEKMTAQM